MVLLWGRAGTQNCLCFGLCLFAPSKICPGVSLELVSNVNVRSGSKKRPGVSWAVLGVLKFVLECPGFVLGCPTICLGCPGMCPGVDNNRKISRCA